MILAPGARVGPYQIVSLIGHGGVGEVYLAADPRLRRQVALKVLNAKYAGDENARARFLREAQMAAGLDHPNICALHEIGTGGDFDYLVMPYMRGETLADRLERGRLPAREALDIAVQLADALAYAHDAGVIHRDIKPQNVMLTPEGRVKLMDFGLAKAPGRLDGQDETQAALTATGAFFGTIAYMSPEQLAGHPADARSDIFSLGMTLYQIFAGRHPFAGSTAAAMITAIASRPAAALSAVAPDAPSALTPVLAKTLALDPRERYQSTRELRADLEAARRGDPVAMVTSAPAVRTPPTRAILVALLGAIGLAVAVWLGSDRGQTGARPGSDQGQTGVRPPSPASPPATVAATVSTWLEIQPPGSSDPVHAVRSIGGDVLQRESKFRVHIVMDTPGSLYIVGDEKPVSQKTDELTLLYPMPDGAGTVSGAMATDWNVVGGPAAGMTVWVAWYRNSIRELEALRPLVNARDLGIVRDRKQADDVRRLLHAGEPFGTSSIDSQARRVTLRSTQGILVHAFRLSHR